MSGDYTMRLGGMTRQIKELLVWRGVLVGLDNNGRAWVLESGNSEWQPLPELPLE
jgi:hypothetical protein